MTVEPIAVSAFIGEKWEFFGTLEKEATSTLVRTSRRLPPQFYSHLNQGLLQSLTEASPNVELQCKVVLDTSIVVADAIRVSKGLESSTERILSSPYIEVLAPPQIQEETPRILKERIPDKDRLRTALAHASRLLSQVRIASGFSIRAARLASELIGAHSPEDVCFLALAIGSDAEALVSLDRRAFDAQSQVTRWRLGKLVQVVVDRESGALSLLIASTSLAALGRALAWLLTQLFAALERILIGLVGIAAALFQGAVEGLTQVPDWLWAVLAVVSVGGVIAYALHQGFRDWVNTTGGRIQEIIATIFENLKAGLSTLFVVLKQLAVMSWNLLVPVTSTLVVVCGVLAGRISALITSLEEHRRAA